jgi:ribosome-associated translation inhibitor RaiA
MSIQLQITFRGMEPSDAVEAKIREMIEWLERFYDRLMRCHVVVEAPHQHPREGNLYCASLELTIPGAPAITVDRAHHDKHEHEDVLVAIRDAFAAARRHLQSRGSSVRAARVARADGPGRTTR